MKEYLKPIIVVQEISVEDVLATSSNFVVTDSEPSWDGDTFGEK